MWKGRLVENEEKGKANGDSKTDLNTSKHGANESSHPDEEVEEVSLVEEDCLLELKQADARWNDDRTHRVVGHKLEHRCKEQKHEHDEYTCNTPVCEV